jgi:hypothetical protein
MDPEDEHEHMGIYEISAMGAGIAYGGGVEIETMLRKGTVVFCEAGGMTVDFEKVIVEFETEDLAEEFEEAVKIGTARIVLDEDRSINAAPKEIQEEWGLALVSENEERLEALRKELWEDFGLYAENPPVRETSGIKRLAIMHDHGVNTFGFKGREKELHKWMARNGFDPRDLHHHNLAMYD